MTLFDWLSTGTGIEFTHALIVLIIAVSGYISYRNHANIARVDRKLDAHVASAQRDVTP